MELLRDEGPKPVGEIGEDERLYWNNQYLGRRCRLLAKQGLIVNIGNGVYQITDDGRAYLDGDLDARGLPEPDDE
ncbi:winged helix-turn-helix domain-containing protein [Salinarchaeum laminariae]|uniref:winged helix-turn-helix domain-containing protein n=1 Tax=Salinarchaeum laminariae TaxID=869888 RepID=UPI0020BDACBE|nr:winged helix-turn-helix domain-containing protein [Salinarchaeum laminariae]